MNSTQYIPLAFPADVAQLDVLNGGQMTVIVAEFLNCNKEPNCCFNGTQELSNTAGTKGNPNWLKQNAKCITVMKSKVQD